MKKLCYLSILLPINLFCVEPESVKPAIISHEGVNIHVNLANSHDVENKNNTNASNQVTPTTHVVHVIVTKTPTSWLEHFKKAVVPVAICGVVSKIPFKELAEGAKEALKKVDVNQILKHRPF